MEGEGLRRGWRGREMKGGGGGRRDMSRDVDGLHKGEPLLQSDGKCADKRIGTVH